jgi:hypothetical protein
MYTPGVANQIMAVRRKDNAPGDADMADRAGARPAANAVVPVESPLVRPSHQLPPPFQVVPRESVLIHRCVTRCCPPGVSAICVFERFKPFGVEIGVQRPATHVGEFRAAIFPPLRVPG